ncbi:hypothetical protein [Streptomyces mexicanus]|uniref:hypothetical protein n=1 Tax=Streptomyces mexicanus TaxID=178566 RepID=UPI0036461343
MKRLLRVVAAQGWVYDGSIIVWRRRTDALAAWVRRGRRPDLPGWRGALGPLVRLLLLGVLVYAVWGVVRAVPWLLWLFSACWLRAAWKAAKTAPPAADEPVEETPAAPDAEAVRALLLGLMGEDSAVHLRTVLAHLQQHGQAGGWTIADLRSRLEALGIPVRDKVKAGRGGPTRGVHRADLAPSPVVGQEPSTEASTAA